MRSFPLLRYRCALLLLFLVGTMGRVSRGAEAPPPAKLGENAPPLKGSTPSHGGDNVSVTQHSVTVNGKVLNYKATTGYLVLKEEIDKPPARPEAEKDKAPKGPGAADEALKPKAKIFFVAYTLDGADAATRPVTFAFNGGPGAASVWLHLGALGPRRVKFDEAGNGTRPPYQLVNNEFSWLDQTDLVFIDPVSTGYSRPTGGETAKAFHSFNADLQSVADFIRLYTTENNRWLAPKFLVGESYGGTRAAALTGILQDRFDLYLNGVVIVAGVFSWQTIDFRAGNDLPYSLFLPGYTATAWYHKRLSGEMQQKALDQVRREAEEFASGDYLLALVKGNRLSEAERTRFANRLAALTGLPAETILRYNLRVPAGRYMDELLKSERRAVGRFDSRLTGIAFDPEGADFDPSFTTMRGNITAGMNAYVRTELKFETELPYYSLANVSPWSFGNFENRYLEVGDSLARAMTRDPHLKVWVIGGYYDLAVPYFAADYALRQMPLDPSVARNVRTSNYEGGHMFYTQEGPLRAFKADFDAFVTDALR